MFLRKRLQVNSERYLTRRGRIQPAKEKDPDSLLLQHQCQNYGNHTHFSRENPMCVTAETCNCTAIKNPITAFPYFSIWSQSTLLNTSKNIRLVGLRHILFFFQGKYLTPFMGRNGNTVYGGKEGEIEQLGHLAIEDAYSSFMMEFFMTEFFFSQVRLL